MPKVFQTPCLGMLGNHFICKLSGWSARIPTDHKERQPIPFWLENRAHFPQHRWWKAPFLWECSGTRGRLGGGKSRFWLDLSPYIMVLLSTGSPEQPRFHRGPHKGQSAAVFSTVISCQKWTPQAAFGMTSPIQPHLRQLEGTWKVEWGEWPS